MRRSTFLINFINIRVATYLIFGGYKDSFSCGDYVGRFQRENVFFSWEKNVPQMSFEVVSEYSLIASELIVAGNTVIF